MAWNVAEKKNETKRGAPGKAVPLRAPGEGAGSEAAGEEKGPSSRGRGRNLSGGMEMLEVEFLLGVIENTKSNDKNDVAMRKLGFEELIRREQVSEIDSNSLKFYVKDEGDFYGKSIQCESMKGLAARTSGKG